MSEVRVSKYQQVRWLDALVAAIDHAQLYNGASAVGSSVAVSTERRGLVLVNSTAIALPGSGTIAWLMAGTDLLLPIPFTGGDAAAGALTFGFS